MKIRSMGLLALLAVAGLMMFACEASVDDGETTDTVTGTDTVADTTPATTYSWIRIADDPTNSTLDNCTVNPGADIDAIAVYRGGALLGWAGKIIATNLGDVCTGSAADDPNEALGPSDETDGSDSDNLFVALNGGEIVARIDDEITGDQIVLQEGDQVWVYEVVGTAPEYYYVDLCEDQNCATSIEIGHGTGEGKFTY